MKTTTQIEKTVLGYSVTVDGRYMGSFQSKAKAERYAALVTGAANLDLNKQVWIDDAVDEAARFVAQ